MNTINEYTVEQLEAMLASKKKDDNAKKEAKKRAYEKEKNDIVDSLFEEAQQLSLSISRFKQKCHAVMETQKNKLDEYGKIKKTSKGGFSLIHSSGEKQIIRRRDTDPVWDERAQKAVELIKDFLGDTVKKRAADLHDILMGFLERNAKGDLEFAKVMELLKHEDKFTDERWLEGLRLIKESYSQGFKAFGYEFKCKDKTGKWNGVQLNFASL